MEHPQLANAPLVEALFEVQYPPEASWDWTIPGRLYDEVKDEFPFPEEVNFGEYLYFGPGVPASAPPPDRVQLVAADRRTMIQSAARLLVLNRFPPYQGWEDFRATILRVHRAHSRLIGEHEPSRIGLRYINHLRGDLGKTRLTTAPRTEDLPEMDLLRYAQRCEFSRNTTSVTLLTETALDEGEPITIVDLDLSTREVESGVELTGWLDEAHELAYAVFRNTLRPDDFARLERE